MYRKLFYRASAYITLVVFTGVGILSLENVCTAQPNPQWRIHDINRPLPVVVTPATAGTPEKAGQPPSDAIVLFNGKDLSQWRSKDGRPAKWLAKDGYMAPVKGSGYIRTLQNFGDCQLHLEWAAPLHVNGQGQARGNSGIFLMEKYEVQILDSFDNTTYADGQAASIYGQFPPQVNACRPPGQWQSFDIIFHRPHFDNDGILTRPATITVLHNGVLAHDNVQIKGPTDWFVPPSYEPHPDKLPIALQDHRNPVRFRNIWVRELPAAVEKPAPELPYKEIAISPELLDEYVGKYEDNRKRLTTISKKDDHLIADLFEHAELEFLPGSENTFFSKLVDAELVFQRNEKGNVDSLMIILAGQEISAEKINAEK